MSRERTQAHHLLLETPRQGTASVRVGVGGAELETYRQCSGCIGQGKNKVNVKEGH